MHYVFLAVLSIFIYLFLLVLLFYYLYNKLPNKKKQFSIQQGSHMLTDFLVWMHTSLCLRTFDFVARFCLTITATVYMLDDLLNCGSTHNLLIVRLLHPGFMSMFATQNVSSGPAATVAFPARCMLMRDAFQVRVLL